MRSSIFLVIAFVAYALTFQSVPLLVSCFVSVVLAGAGFLFVRDHKRALPRYIPFDDGRTLAVARILTAIALLIQLVRIRFFDTISLPLELLGNSGEFTFFTSLPWYHFVVQTPGAGTALFVCAVVSLLFVLVGYRVRVSIPVALFSFFMVNGLVNQYFTLYHDGLIALYLLALLVFLPSADRLSLNSLLSEQKAQPKTPMTYGYGVWLVFLLIASVYLSAGVSKLTHVGLSWVSADNVRGHFLNFYFDPNLPRDFAPTHVIHDALIPYTSRFMEIAPDTLLLLLGTLVILLQLSYPLILFMRSARLVLPIAALLFSFGVLVIMGIVFYGLILAQCIVLYWFFVMRKRAALSHHTDVPKHIQYVLVGTLFFWLFNLHGFIQQYPLTSWPMFSHTSQYAVSNSIFNTRVEAVYADGSRKIISPRVELGLYGYPRTCYNGLIDKTHAARSCPAATTEEARGTCINRICAVLHNELAARMETQEPERTIDHFHIQHTLQTQQTPDGPFEATSVIFARDFYPEAE